MGSKNGWDGMGWDEILKNMGWDEMGKIFILIGWDGMGCKIVRNGMGYGISHYQIFMGRPNSSSINIGKQF